MKAPRLFDCDLAGASALNKPGHYERILALLSKVALCLPLATGMLFGFGTPAAAISVYSIVTNPGEDASTQMNIGWHADLGYTDCFVTLRNHDAMTRTGFASSE
jgi:hypothetical protein